MSSVDTVTEAVSEVSVEATASSLVDIPVTKGKSTVSVDLAAIPEEVYKAALIEGLKSFINKGMSKIMTKGLEGEKLAEAQAAAMKKANENLAAINDGSIKLPGRKAKSKVSGAVMTEARRLARNLVKDEIKHSGGKVSHYKASDITAAANVLIESDPELIKMAEENIKKRDEVPVSSKINLATLIKPDAKLVEKAKAANAERKSQLSAKQAGMTKKRGGQGQQATQH